MNDPIYNVKFCYNGVNFEKDVYAFDFGVTYPNCLTMYFKEGGKIIVDIDKIEWYEIHAISGR